MDRAVNYFERAFRAFYSGEWDDLLLQLCPCIEAAAEFEYGQSGRSSFRQFVDDNLPKALYLSGAPAIEKLNISIRTKGYFKESAIKELAKVSIPREEYAIGPSTPDQIEMFESKNEEIRTDKLRYKEEGIFCVPFGHIMYHCLRCEYLHKPGSTGIIEFLDNHSIDNTDHKIKLPISMLYGYILVTLTSPAFSNIEGSSKLYLNWSQIGAVSRIDWLFGKREVLMTLAEMNRKSNHVKPIAE